MKFQINELRSSAKKYQFRLKRSACERLLEHLEFAQEEMRCEAFLLRKELRVQVQGRYEVMLHTNCDKCLDPVQVPLQGTTELTLVPKDEYLQFYQEDQEVSTQEEDVASYDGYRVDLAEVFEEQLLLDIPWQFRCSSKCLGLCPSCGMNRNHETCDCENTKSNSPFILLKNHNS